jgi:hypothetical protein
MDYLIAGWKLVDIAGAMKCTTAALQAIKSSPIFQDEIAQRRAILNDSVTSTLSETISVQEHVNAQLAEGCKLAVDKLLQFVGPDADCSNAIARQSASDLLDRGGFPKLTKTENTQNTIFVLDQDDLARIENTISLDIEQESEILVKSETVTEASFESTNS